MPLSSRLLATHEELLILPVLRKNMLTDYCVLPCSSFSSSQRSVPFLRSLFDTALRCFSVTLTFFLQDASPAALLGNEVFSASDLVTHEELLMFTSGLEVCFIGSSVRKLS